MRALAGLLTGHDERAACRNCRARLAVSGHAVASFGEKRKRDTERERERERGGGRVGGDPGVRLGT